MSSSSEKIMLKSSDEESFEVNKVVASELKIISHMIEDGCAGETIPLQNVTSKILSMVIEYCKKHVLEKEEEADQKDEETKKKELDSWDADFLKECDQETLFELILAANYLNTKSLLDLVAQKIADLIKDKSVEDVREIFKIENDYTPEEEAAIRKEYEWAFN